MLNSMLHKKYDFYDLLSPYVPKRCKFTSQCLHEVNIVFSTVESAGKSLHPNYGTVCTYRIF